MAEQMTNPFKHIRNWIKGELLRLGSLLEAIVRKESVEKMKINAIGRLRDDKATVEKLGSGKFMIGALFKS